MERDQGNMYVLEATMLSLILLGAAYAVQTLQGSSVTELRPRAELSRLVDDALAVLVGLETENGTLLDLYLAEAIHCARDEAPSATDCDGARSANLSVRLDNYLPVGSGYAVGLGNGGAVREIYRSPAPKGEAVSSSATFAPNWSLAFAFTELSCYESGADVNATLIPIHRGGRAWAKEANVTLGASEIAGARAWTQDWWNVTLPAATRPASGTLIANVTGNATFPGAASYGSCSHALGSATLRAALASVTFAASAPSVPITSSVTFDTDLASLGALGGTTIVGANVTIVEPIPPREGVPDTWMRAAVLPMTGGLQRSATWTPASDALYGAHPALLRVGLDIGGVQVEVRKALVVDVALPSGHVPFDAPYRATLQAWLPDWG